jgi:hypothetical protein
MEAMMMAEDGGREREGSRIIWRRTAAKKQKAAF